MNKDDNAWKINKGYDNIFAKHDIHVQQNFKVISTKNSASNGSCKQIPYIYISI